jgi:hypothetical protein
MAASKIAVCDSCVLSLRLIWCQGAGNFAQLPSKAFESVI